MWGEIGEVKQNLLGDSGGGWGRQAGSARGIREASRVHDSLGDICRGIKKVGEQVESVGGINGIEGEAASAGGIRGTSGVCGRDWGERQSPWVGFWSLGGFGRIRGFSGSGGGVGPWEDGAVSLHDPTTKGYF